MSRPGDPRTPRDDMGRLQAELRDMKRRLDDLESPSGSAANQTSSKLGGLNVQGQIDALSEHLEVDLALEAQLRDAAIVAATGSQTGIVLTSPDGTRWKLGVSDAGSTTWTVVT